MARKKKQPTFTVSERLRLTEADFTQFCDSFQARPIWVHLFETVEGIEERAALSEHDYFRALGGELGDCRNALEVALRHLEKDPIGKLTVMPAGETGRAIDNWLLVAFQLGMMTSAVWLTCRVALAEAVSEREMARKVGVVRRSSSTAKRRAEVIAAYKKIRAKNPSPKIATDQTKVASEFGISARALRGYLKGNG